jgi:hypothetical protein
MGTKESTASLEFFRSIHLLEKKEIKEEDQSWQQVPTNSVESKADEEA